MIVVLVVPGVAFEQAQMGKCMLSVDVICRDSEGRELTVDWARAGARVPGAPCLHLRCCHCWTVHLCNSFRAASVLEGTLSGALHTPTLTGDTLLSAQGKLLSVAQWIPHTSVLDTAIALIGPPGALIVVPYLNGTAVVLSLSPH